MFVQIKVNTLPLGLGPLLCVRSCAVLIAVWQPYYHQLSLRALCLDDSVLTVVLQPIISQIPGLESQLTVGSSLESWKCSFTSYMTSFFPVSIWLLLLFCFLPFSVPCLISSLLTLRLLLLLFLSWHSFSFTSFSISNHVLHNKLGTCQWVEIHFTLRTTSYEIYWRPHMLALLRVLLLRGNFSLLRFWKRRLSVAHNDADAPVITDTI